MFFHYPHVDMFNVRFTGTRRLMFTGMTMISLFPVVT